MGVLWYVQVYRGGPGCVWKCSGVWVCTDMGGCVWDEFSEYLLETRVLTSADFNTYPIRIFYKKLNEVEKNFPRDTSKVKVHDMKLFALKLVSCCEM